MKNFFIATCLLLNFNYSFAEIIKLETTEANCKKVDGYAEGVKLEIAQKYSVPVASVNFLGTKWRGKCDFIFDTAKGPTRCLSDLYSDDKGKTAFGTLKDSWGQLQCGY
jgi:hypothetical protein